MKRMFLLVLALLCLYQSDAQKNAQGKVLFAVMEELAARNGEESLRILYRIKTPTEFVRYMRAKAKTCHNCPVLQDFIKGLSAPAILPKVIPKIGEEPVVDENPPPPIALNFGGRVLEYYEANIYGIDDSQPQLYKCGPFYGLARWGCPLPCRGFCPTDPINVPAGINDESYADESGEDYDYDYEDSSTEEEFNYDDYESPDSNYDYEYEYDPD